MLRTHVGQPVRLLDYRVTDYLIDEVELDISLDRAATRVVSTLKLRPHPQGHEGAALRLDIAAPDDAMMAELIATHAEARGLAIGEDGARYLALRAERSHLAAERLVATIDRLSLERKQAPGPAIWREALEEISGQSQPRLL